MDQRKAHAEKIKTAHQESKLVKMTQAMDMQEANMKMMFDGLGALDKHVLALEKRIELLEKQNEELLALLRIDATRD